MIRWPAAPARGSPEWPRIRFVPELPEVETIARGVHDRVRAARIVAAWFGSHTEPMKSSAAAQERLLTGARFLSVHRVGKHIVCDLAAPRAGADAGAANAQWIVHLGMTGRLLVTEAEAPVVEHTHARLTLEDGREIRFVDARRFGRLEIRDLEIRDPEIRDLEIRDPETRDLEIRDLGHPRQAQRFSGPGSEPLTIGSGEFYALFHPRRTSIKAALLNQSLLHGVGNIYADESLFRSGIRPRTQASRLTRAQLERLRVELRTVLEQAIALGGSSVSDYVDANGVKGFFQLEHRVYGRTGQPCRICGTAIRRIVLAGRSTHFCSQCQR